MNHELGHVVHKHVFVGILMTAVSFIIMFTCFAFALDNKGIIEAFGFSNVSNFLYLFLFTKLYMPLQFINNAIGMQVIRKNEYQADEFAVKHNHGNALKKGLVNLFKRNKGPLVADPLYSRFNHSHPTMIERLQAIDKAMVSENE